MADISEECFPDYICDLYSSRQLEYFPDNIFDCILDAHCAIMDKFNVYNPLKRLLKTNGYFATINYFDNLDAYLNDHTLGKINKELNKELIANDPDMIEYVNKSFDKARLNPAFKRTDNQIMYFMVSSAMIDSANYADGKRKNKKITIVPELIKQLQKKYSTKILKKHGYRYIKHFGPYMSKPYLFEMSYLFFKPYPE